MKKGKMRRFTEVAGLLEGKKVPKVDLTNYTKKLGNPQPEGQGQPDVPQPVQPNTPQPVQDEPQPESGPIIVRIYLSDKNDVKSFYMFRGNDLTVYKAPTEKEYGSFFSVKAKYNNPEDLWETLEGRYDNYVELDDNKANVFAMFVDTYKKYKEYSKNKKKGEKEGKTKAAMPKGFKEDMAKYGDLEGMLDEIDRLYDYVLIMEKGEEVEEITGDEKTADLVRKRLKQDRWRQVAYHVPERKKKKKKEPRRRGHGYAGGFDIGEVGGFYGDEDWDD